MKFSFSMCFSVQFQTRKIDEYVPCFSTFKLVPKNVPPEALQDAKGVVFSCESDADVEKWCDVLNKAALGFIIQPSPRPEKGT